MKDNVTLMGQPTELQLNNYRQGHTKIMGKVKSLLANTDNPPNQQLS